MKRKTFFVFLVGFFFCISSHAFAKEFKFWAFEDSYVNAAEEWADRNYGDSEYLRVRDLDNNNFSDYISRTFIRFDQNDLMDALSGLDIISASLHLYEYDRGTNSSTEDEVNLFRVTEKWTEDSITWNNQPAHANQRITYRLFSSDDTTPGWRGWYGLDNLVEWWVTGEKPNYGIMLENDLDGQYTQMNVKFRSSEYYPGGNPSIYRPYLKVVATPEPASFLLFGMGAGLLGLYRRRKNS